LDLITTVSNSNGRPSPFEALYPSVLATKKINTNVDMYRAGVDMVLTPSTVGPVGHSYR